MGEPGRSCFESSPPMAVAGGIAAGTDSGVGAAGAGAGGDTEDVVT